MWRYINEFQKVLNGFEKSRFKFSIIKLNDSEVKQIDIISVMIFDQSFIEYSNTCQVDGTTMNVIVKLFEHNNTEYSSMHFHWFILHTCNEKENKDIEQMCVTNVKGDNLHRKIIFISQNIVTLCSINTIYRYMEDISLLTLKWRIKTSKYHA